MSLDALDWRLMNDWQRALPLVPRPFQVIADHHHTTEDQILDRLQTLLDTGAISRVGATCRPNTLAASTLAAVAAPEDQIDEIAKIINAQEGVNHSYERENKWNIWFVATGPTRAFVNDILARITAETGLRVLDLRLRRPFNVDLGFALDGSNALPAPRVFTDDIEIEEGDRALMQALSDGLPLTPTPFATLAERLGQTETAIIERVRTLAEAGILSRIGLIVRHRALGWRANAMCVFVVPPDRIEACGTALTKVQGVTLCYERRAEPDVWPYTLYCMIHGRSRSETLDVLTQARVAAGMVNFEYRILFSTRCFRQRGALIDVASETPNGN
ncbi:Lrp/AsnC family transcriptional regulator [Marivita sp. S6314]|uniref:siroheme decarboxylase subunit beta n=1 Tax=Marivita sp. S6314 TaxID=2926406 RepID=UPI001FF54FB3|nr:Lrp/AsnC family transcriptional regulator [Marivita sp. S6314]MCK0150478.1 Lrp/AsnC family transcriptional regulator [Marivita sp. S6314]